MIFVIWEKIMNTSLNNMLKLLIADNSAPLAIKKLETMANFFI